MNLNDWVDYLMKQHPIEIDMGLARVSEVAKRLELTDIGASKIITVAGTNGKGTTCAFLERILLKAGYRVGVYSSPHLLRFNERVRIDGEDVHDSDLIHAFECIELIRNEISLTFFEFTTLAGILIFKQKCVNVVLLEVGLGGRLDATNIIDSDMSVITSIDLDHQFFLGNTRESVGIEKVGVCRARKPAIMGEPNVPVKVQQKLVEIEADTYFVGKQFSSQLNETHWSFIGKRSIDNIDYPQLPLQNAVTAVETILHFDDSITDEIIRDGIKEANVPGRMERVSSSPLLLLDVAHNPHAARYLNSQLLKYKDRNIYALCGMLKDKDIQTVINELTESVSHWNLATLDVERGATAQEIADCFETQDDVRCFCSIKSAWEDLREKITVNDVVIVFGSFYTVAGFKMLKQG